MTPLSPLSPLSPLEIVSVPVARVVILVAMDEVNPRGRVPLPDVAGVLLCRLLVYGQDIKA